MARARDLATGRLATKAAAACCWPQLKLRSTFAACPNWPRVGFRRRRCLAATYHLVGREQVGARRPLSGEQCWRVARRRTWRGRVARRRALAAGRRPNQLRRRVFVERPDACLGPARARLDSVSAVAARANVGAACSCSTRAKRRSPPPPPTLLSLAALQVAGRVGQVVGANRTREHTHTLLSSKHFREQQQKPLRQDLLARHVARREISRTFASTSS